MVLEKSKRVFQFVLLFCFEMKNCNLNGEKFFKKKTKKSQKMSQSRLNLRLINWGTDP